MNALKSVGNLGSQANKLLAIKSVVSSRIFNFQSLATTLNATVKLQRSSSASSLIHTDITKRKELFGANQCDPYCISNTNATCKRCDQYCQTLRDQIEANMKNRAIPKVEETIIKPCIESAPKKNDECMTSSISGGNENNTAKTDGNSIGNASKNPKNSQDLGQVPDKQIKTVSVTKPLATQPTMTKENNISTSAPQSEHLHSFSYLLETCDLNPIDFKSESKFSRPKTIRNLPKTESIKQMKTISNPASRALSGESCLSIGTSGGETFTTFSTQIKKKEADNCLVLASSSKDASSLRSNGTVVPEIKSNFPQHLVEQPKEQKAVSQINTDPHSTADIRLSPCNKSGSASVGSAPCGGTSGSSNQSTSSSSPCKNICNQPTKNTGSASSESNNCKNTCNSPLASSNSSTNECSSEDKTSICKQICCQALKEIVEPTPRKKTTTAIAPSEPAKAVIKPKTACKKRCGSSDSENEPTVDKMCSNISNKPEYKAGCGPKPVKLQCDKPAESKTKCNPVKECENAPKTSTCGSASRAAIKCTKPDSKKTCQSEPSKNVCGSSKCMPSQPQRPQKRR